MGRPKGSKNKGREVSPIVEEVKKVKPKSEPELVKEAVNVKEEKAQETQNVVVLNGHLPVLPAGQCYFEDGPTGEVIVGDSTRDQVWFRKGNNGKGCWINKKR